MTVQRHESCYAVQSRRCAILLSCGVILGVTVLIVTYVLYICGIVDPLIPVDELPAYWDESSDRFVAEVGGPAGWGWLAVVGKGDYLGMFGIVVLGLLPFLSSISLVPTYVRTKDWEYAIIALLLASVLLLSICGLKQFPHCY